MIDRLYYSNVILLLILLQIINQLIMSDMDNKIFIYLLTSDNNNLLCKYRDYFNICNYIPQFIDKYLFIFAYVFYLPIIVVLSIIQYFNHKNENLINILSFNLKYPLMLSKGMVYNAILPYFYCIKLKSRLNNNTFNKLSWNTLFTDNNIPTPKIISTCTNNVLSDQNKIDDYIKNNKKLIIKPVEGSCGNDVSIFDVNKIPLHGNFVIQELIESNNRSFRIITNCYNETISLWDIYLLVGDSIVTNMSKGGKTYKYINKKFINKNNKIIKLNEKENKFLNEAIDLAKKCHKELIFCPTIGWDVILNKDSCYFLEGNIGVTISCDVDKNPMNKQKEYLDFVQKIYNHIIK